jgi:hypothetical protein
MDHLKNKHAHLITGKDEDNFQCKICYQLFDCNESLQIHLQSHPAKYFHCEICEERFDTQFNLDDHYKIHKNQAAKKNTNDDKDVLGDFDELDELNMPKVVSEVDEDSNSDNDQELEELEEMVKKMGDTGEGAWGSDEEKEENEQPRIRNKLFKNKCFQCVTCHDNFEMKKEWELHEKTAHTDLEHPCPFCRFRGESKTILNKHLRSHGERNKACDLCQKKFKTNVELKRHRLRHFKIDKKCDLCGSRQVRKAIRHIREKKCMDKSKTVKCPCCPHLSRNVLNMRKHWRRVCWNSTGNF